MPDYPPTELGIFALSAPNRYLAAKTRVFIDSLVARFGETPEWDRLARGRSRP
jgi:DNA-binding transcriptional LysR family regulator